MTNGTFSAGAVSGVRLGRKSTSDSESKELLQALLRVLELQAGALYEAAIADQLRSNTRS